MATTNKCLAQSNKSRTFAEVRASRNTIETISLSRGNHFHANVCAPVELAPSRQGTNGQRRYSCRARRSRYTPGLTREREYDEASPNLRSLWRTFRHGDASLVGHQVLQEDVQRCIPP